MTCEKNILAVRVRLLNCVPKVDRDYDYDPGENNVSPGDIVGVPFGNTDRHQFAVVTETLTDKSEKKLKKILFVLDPIYSLTDLQLKLCRHFSDHLFCSFGEAARSMLPSGITVKTAVNITSAAENGYTESTEFEKLAEKYRNKYSIPKEKLAEIISGNIGKDEYHKVVEALLKKGLLKKTTSLIYAENEKSEKAIRLICTDEELLPGGKASSKYAALFNLLSESEDKCASLAFLTEKLRLNQSNINTLKKSGIIEVFERKVHRNAYNIPKNLDKSEINLSHDQEEAFKALEADLLDTVPHAALLYGITGSGKTVVMMKLIDKALEEGRGVIYLVPEIALTGSLAERLIGRYGDCVAVLHSGLSNGERHDAWKAVKEGTKRIVLGTRSAVFCPMDRIGIIILDEEHDRSYKSENGMRYHARDAARFICAKQNALMLLASATPDISSFYKAEKGIYELIRLENRFSGQSLPEVRICDMRDERADAPDRLIGSTLFSEIARNLDRGEQTILFMNRRGYRNFMLCHSCGEAIKCPNCSVTLTVHGSRSSQELKCHYCGYTAKIPPICPNCGKPHLGTLGSGTQKLEEELLSSFPGVRILRMDADTVTEKGSRDTILDSFKAHEADILIGTQMVAKGHDFPLVTLVGVVTADQSLYNSDFKAYENTFSLVTQVVGRAGRASLPGRAIIQTYNPQHEVFALAEKQDYQSFYNSEIKLRKSLLFPPFCEICVFTLSSKSEKLLDEAAKRLSDGFAELLGGDYVDVKVVVYGPFEATVYKIDGVYRKRFIVKNSMNLRTREMFRALRAKFYNESQNEVYLNIDTNPLMI